MNLFKYSLKRLFMLMIVLIGISIITFTVVRIIPAEPAAIYLGPKAKPEQIEKLSEEMGLNKPIVTQYVIYLSELVKGDWGTSLRTHRPVLDDMIRYLPNTLELLILGLFFATALGIPLGVISAKYKGKFFDQITRIGSIFGVSVPSFWIALVFQLIFFSKLGLLPINGQIPNYVQTYYPVDFVTGFTLLDMLLTGNFIGFYYTFPHYILPALTLSLYPLGLITRMTRSNVLEVMESDFIKLAKANGISQIKVMFHYSLKNAMGPILTVIGLMFAYSIMGSFFVEIIYNWPGIGRYAVESILSMDHPAIMGVTLLVAFFYVVVNLLTDLIQIWLDPRIKLEGDEV